MKTDWSLTADSLERFLSWLASDREEAGRRYEELRKRLIRFFTRGGCDDPEELFDRTVDRASKKIASGEVERLDAPFAFCYGVARYILSEYQHKPKLDPLSDNLAKWNREPDWDERELECLDQCLMRLSDADREMVKRYHTYVPGEKIPMRRTMADKVGGYNKLRIRICRITDHLRDCVEACLKQPAEGLAH